MVEDANETLAQVRRRRELTARLTGNFQKTNTSFKFDLAEEWDCLFFVHFHMGSIIFSASHKIENYLSHVFWRMSGDRWDTPEILELERQAIEMQKQGLKDMVMMHHNSKFF